MRVATHHGMPHPILMKFVLKLLANLTEPRGAPISQPTGDDTVILRGLIAPVGDAGCQYTAGRLACAVTGGTLQVRDVG